MFGAEVPIDRRICNPWGSAKKKPRGLDPGDLSLVVHPLFLHSVDLLGTG
jgi:hypothetical protein